MDRIEALKKVIESDGFSEAEKETAIAALREIAETGSTAHERDTANHVLQALDDSDIEKPLDENTLRLLELLGLTEKQWRAACRR